MDEDKCQRCEDGLILFESGHEPASCEACGGSGVKARVLRASNATLTRALAESREDVALMNARATYDYLGCVRCEKRTADLLALLLAHQVREATAEARAEKMREGIEDFHRAECGCLDWKRDTQCMTLRALTAPTPPQQEK